ncbi:MAG TPA: ZIP family metal transporter [Syntrophorhabdaceae bacterium]|nr:ZIP family metal transporter [Syntrophorhabdaceae bacterium]
MDTFIFIVGGGFLMSAIALVGGLTTLLGPVVLERVLLPLVALASGTLLGGGFFHMIPEGGKLLSPLGAALWLMGGFSAFLALEQFLHWHHSHSKPAEAKKPVTYLILIGDAVHNFLGGLGIGSTFLISPKAGVIAWIAAAAHEIPQELGDFGVLVHGGWPKRRALLWNLFSALSFPLGGLIAWIASRSFNVSGLVLFGAGSFIYIAASDLIPEIKAQESLPRAILHFLFFAVGLAMMFALAYCFQRN